MNPAFSSGELGNYVLLSNLASALYMTGLIWFVQLVHYPLFAHVGNDCFAQYSNLHQSRTTIAVAPMLLEAGSAASLILVRPSSCPTWVAMIGLSLVALIWASTFFLQVPLHGRLAAGFDNTAIERLALTNWIRTILWSARSSLLLWAVAHEMRM